ncbi:hypothetical protein S40285_09929 [Stachybotrys chlorohalonatus IBT 40285]|uniref:Uncharacterized protein n=1 Tax=Stachybotrys chlorohalonatus (strain IBT 40285) TaxID=1283841 RepID=A0A084R2E8_STAC4|nr:hypothetical protein S40285_09929 [Stachybotrys chlorohalonata IBT 40285]
MQQGDAGLRAVLPIETSLIGEPPAVRVGWLQVTDFAVFGTPAKIVAVIVHRIVAGEAESTHVRDVTLVGAFNGTDWPPCLEAVKKYRTRLD